MKTTNLKKTNLTPAINYLRKRIEAVSDAITTFERIAEEYLEQKAQSASVRSTDVATLGRRSEARVSDPHNDTDRQLTALDHAMVNFDVVSRIDVHTRS